MCPFSSRSANRSSPWQSTLSTLSPGASVPSRSIGNRLQLERWQWHAASSSSQARPRGPVRFCVLSSSCVLNAAVSSSNRVHLTCSNAAVVLAILPKSALGSCSKGALVGGKRGGMR
uniref:Uncharacterized protein n=1 Tax=Coccolithus braarudii TaxID=221442 RepID=A0A6T7KS80_9EUKA